MRNGDGCLVTAGTHKGKTGNIADRQVSKGGNVTITVRQSDGTRCKTLERRVAPQV
ncbi:MAG: RNA-binding protein [Sphingomonadales bacterium]|nr:MAG: RNA-binding protein [Sphingomonadales bacterium]